MTTRGEDTLLACVIEVAGREGIALATDEAVLVNLLGLECPEPLMMLRQSMRQSQESQRLLVFANDPSTKRDIPTYCRFTGHKLEFQCVLETEIPHDLSSEGFAHVFSFLIQKSAA